MQKPCNTLITRIFMHWLVSLSGQTSQAPIVDCKQCFAIKSFIHPCLFSTTATIQNYSEVIIYGRNMEPTRSY